MIKMHKKRKISEIPEFATACCAPISPFRYSLSLAHCSLVFFSFHSLPSTFSYFLHRELT